MSEAMKFQSKHLLSYAELESLITTPFPTEKADIIKNKMKYYILIIENENQKEKLYYRFDLDNVLYHKEVYDENKIITSISLLLEQSFKNLSDIEKELLMNKYAKQYRSIFKNSFVSSCLPQVRVFLTNYDIQFNKPHLNEIHFKNGYYDLKTNEFKLREVNKHYISHFIDREYKETSDEMKQLVLNDIRKIYVNKEDLDYLLMTYGIALTGHSTSEQTILFLLGLGSSGKSTIIELIKLCCGNYIYTLPKQTFSKGYSKIDKVMNSYLKNPHIRLSHINEPEDVKIDESLFKDFADGNIQSTSLFQDGSNDFTHNSKLVFTANTYPNIIVDTGTERRVDSYSHMSKFVMKEELVDEKQNIFLGDINYLSKCKSNNNYLNAFFKILVNYAYDWNNSNIKYQQPENFRKTKNEVMVNNDIIQDFIDKCIIMTNNEKDRIGKNEMYDLFKEEYPKKYLTTMQLFNSLKQKNIKYQSDYRKNGIKGCYIGVKINDKDYDSDDEPINQLYPNLDKINDTNNKVEILQKRILELEEMVKNNKEIEMKKNKNEMKLLEENKQVNASFMDVMSENKKLKKLLGRNNIDYTFEEIKLNDIINESNIQEDIESDDEENKSTDEFEKMRRKTLEENKKIREKHKQKTKTKNKINFDEFIDNNEVFQSIF